MKKYILNLVIILAITFVIFPSLLVTQEGNVVRNRSGMFVTRKGFAEIGDGINGRVFFKTELNTRELVGNNDVIMVKKNSKGELLIREGETLIFENTTFFIEEFNDKKLDAELMHGVIESDLSNMGKGFPITIEADSLIMKTAKNVKFRMRNDKQTMSSGVLVKSGYVWVFDKVNKNTCVILKEGESIIIPESGSIFDANMSENVSVEANCKERFKEEVESN